MQIHDLTKGKYAVVSDLISRKQLDDAVVSAFSYLYIIFNRNFLYNRYYLGTMTEKQLTLLQEVPVFLVDRTMSGQSIWVPGTEVKIDVPKDTYDQDYYIKKDETYDDFFRRLRDYNDDLCKERECYPLPLDRDNTLRSTEIVDLLGVYVATQDSLMPKRIFVWVDKVLDCASHDQDNAHALLEQVILHEYAHALLDVTLYGFRHTNYISYQDYLYYYMEEACANAISLTCAFRLWSSKQQKFIENFVKSQPKAYAAGWDLYDARCDTSVTNIFEFWMQTKVYVGKKEIDILERFWKRIDFRYLHLSEEDLYVYNNKNIFLVKYCGNEMWAYRTKQTSDLLGLIRIEDIPAIVCPQNYHFYWSFDSNNLCRVCRGSLYGYINENGQEQIPVVYKHISSFENGLTVAKNQNDYYGIIDEQNNIVVPFTLDYTDMRGLRNGYATVKDYNGWGAVDATGKEVIPCKYDNLVIFNEKGIAKVTENGETFYIDTNDNRIS